MSSGTMETNVAAVRERTARESTVTADDMGKGVVARDGIEPPTHGFSVCALLLRPSKA